MSGKLITIAKFILKAIFFLPIYLLKLVFHKVGKTNDNTITKVNNDNTKNNDTNDDVKNEEEDCDDSNDSNNPDVPYEVAFDATYLFSSGRKYKNWSFSQLNANEKEIFTNIIGYLNVMENIDYVPTEAKHIYLNKKLDSIDFELCDETYHIIKDKGEWDCLDDEDFWERFGEGDDEWVYIPPK